MILKLLRSHFTAALALLAAIFLAVIVGFYVWGVGYLVASVAQVDNGNMAVAPAQQFNLDGAAKLDYRGLAPVIPAAGTTNGQ